MDRYVDKTGGLIVEKSQTAQQPMMAMMLSVDDGIAVPAEDVVNSVDIYLDSTADLAFSNERHQCPICRNQTSYKKNTICISCWEKYRKDLLDGLRNAVADVEFQIK